MYYWLTRLFVPATQLYSRSVLLWNIVLDSGFGPRLPDVSEIRSEPKKQSHRLSLTQVDSLCLFDRLTPNQAFCTDCIGTMELSPENTYTFQPQAHVISSFSAVSASLQSFGGGVSKQLGVEFPRRGHNQYSSWLGCLDQPLGFGATYDGGSLSKYINGTAFEKEKRIGILLSNKCNNAFSIKIGVDDRSMNFQVKPGLSALTFTLNSTQTSDSFKLSIGKFWLLSPLLLSSLLIFFQF